MYHCHRFQPVDCISYVPSGLVAHVLPDNLSLVVHTEQYRSAVPVQEGTKGFHTALQLTGGFLELHQSAFFFGYQPFYYIKVFYNHI